MELNQAMLRQYGCRYLVTKDTGKQGGFLEKYSENQKTAEPASFVKIVEEKVKKSDCFMQSYAVK